MGRINLKIKNKTDESIVCRKILCSDIRGLDVGDQLSINDEKSYTVDTNDKVFCLWEGMITSTQYQLAMTCPKSSRNSAAGYGSAGLQFYSRGGTPANFTFHIGKKDMADWDNGDEYKGNAPEFGICSKENLTPDQPQ